jgi:hypothetical protein
MAGFSLHRVPVSAGTAKAERAGFRSRWALPSEMRCLAAPPFRCPQRLGYVSSSRSSATTCFLCPDSMRKILPFLAVLASLYSTSAPAQTGDPLVVSPGERVRLSPLLYPRFGPAQPPPVQGTVSAVRGDTLELRLDGGMGYAAIPLASGIGIEVSRGVPSRVGSALDGALRGAVQLGLLAPLVALVSDAAGGKQVSALQATGIMAAVGALAGAFQGAIMPEERWRRLRRPIAPPAVRVP